MREVDGTFTIYDVPVFASVAKGVKGAPKDIDGDWMQAALDKSKLREADGYLAPLHFEHHDSGERSFKAGHYRLTRVGPITLAGESKLAVFADFVKIPEGVFNAIMEGHWPYRSVEIVNYDAKEIESIALLDDETPFHKFALLNSDNIMVEEPEPVGAGAPDGAIGFRKIDNGFAAMFSFASRDHEKTKEHEVKDATDSIRAIFAGLAPGEVISVTRQGDRILAGGRAVGLVSQFKRDDEDDTEVNVTVDNDDDKEAGEVFGDDKTENEATAVDTDEEPRKFEDEEGGEGAPTAPSAEEPDRLSMLKMFAKFVSSELKRAMLEAGEDTMDEDTDEERHEPAGDDSEEPGEEPMASGADPNQSTESEDENADVDVDAEEEDDVKKKEPVRMRARKEAREAARFDKMEHELKVMRTERDLERRFNRAVESLRGFYLSDRTRERIRKFAAISDEALDDFVSNFRETATPDGPEVLDEPTRDKEPTGLVRFKQLGPDTYAEAQRFSAMFDDLVRQGWRQDTAAERDKFIEYQLTTRGIKIAK